MDEFLPHKSELEQERLRLGEANAQVRAYHRQLVEHDRKWREYFSEFRKSVVVLQQEKAELVKHVQGLQKALENTAAEKKALKSRFSAREDEFARTEVSLRNQIDTSARRLDEYGAATQRITEELRRELVETRSLLEAAESCKLQLQGRVAAFEKQNDSVDQEFADVARAIASQNGQIENCEKLLQTQTSQIASFAERLLQNLGEVSQLKSELVAIAERQLRFEEQVKGVDLERRAMQEYLMLRDCLVKETESGFTMAVARLQGELEGMKKSLTGSRESERELLKKIDKAENQLTLAEKERHGLSAELQDCKSQIDAQKDKINQLDKVICVQRNEMQGLSERARQTLEELVQLKDKRAIELERYAGLEQRLFRSRESVAALSAKADDEKFRKDELQRQVDAQKANQDQVRQLQGLLAQSKATEESLRRDLALSTVEVHRLERSQRALWEELVAAEKAREAALRKTRESGSEPRRPDPRLGIEESVRDWVARKAAVEEASVALEKEREALSRQSDGKGQVPHTAGNHDSEPIIIPLHGPGRGSAARGAT